MKKAEFQLEPFLPKTFTGYSSENAWNGWDRPLFEKSEAIKIVEAQNQIAGNSAFYDEENDVFIFRTVDEDERYFAETVEGMKLYSIGSGVWIWEEVK